MPYCGECGKHYNDELKFCPFCGAPNTISKKNEQDSYATEIGITTNSATTQLEDTGAYGGNNFDNIPPGTIIDGKYKIEEKLGKGGFGTVYKAWYENLDEYRAIKVISTEYYDDKEVIADLKSEAKKLNRINDIHVVRFYDVHLDGDFKYIDMEYVDGGDLVDLKLSYPDKKVPEDKVLDIARQFAQGMTKIHEQHIIHKDIKPQNVMLTKDGTVKIMDFGIAEQFRSSRSRLKHASRAGTPVYMSPEHLIGEDVGKEADIWSFGVMLYELLAGKLLYNGQTSNEILMQIERKELKPIPGISEKTNDLLKKCLSYKFRERFRSFNELVQEIDFIINPPKKRKPKVIKKFSTPKRTKKKKVKKAVHPKKEIPEEKTPIRIDTKIALGWFILSIVSICIFLIDYMQTFVLLISISSLVSGIALVVLRRKKLHGLGIALYWLGISFMIFILFQFLFDEFDITMGNINDDEFGPMVATMLSMASGIFIMKKRKEKIEEIEIPIYWLGFSLSFFVFSGCLSEGLGITFWGLHRDETGRIVSIIVIPIITAFLIKKRLGKITGKEIGIYWLGLSIIGVITTVFIAGGYSMSIAIIVSLAVGIILMVIYWKKSKNTNWIYYWFAISIILTVIMMELFYRSGAYYTSLATLVSGMVLLKIRKNKKNRIEIASFWAGLSVAVNFLMCYVFEQLDIEFWIFYDELTGSIIACITTVLAAFFINKNRVKEIRGAELALYITGLALQVMIYFTIK